VQAAAQMIVKPLAGAAGFSDRVIDLRVDDHRAPIPELHRLLNVLRGVEKITEATTQLRNNQAAEALRTALAARDLAPGSDYVWVGLGFIYMALGRKAECFEALRKAVELNPANKSQLPRNVVFEPLRSEAEFGKIFD
jgi:uncharacterized Ntn-hydrolase superfamily protein